MILFTNYLIKNCIYICGNVTTLLGIGLNNALPLYLEIEAYNN